MKKNLLLLMALVFMTVPVYAEVTLEQTTDTEYLINSGYSQALAEDVFVIKNRALGNTIEPLYEKPQNTFVKGWNKFWAYLDPARDTYDKVHHDINLTPSFNDL